MSPEKINEFKEAFDSFDDEGKGKLSKAQFRKFVESANCEDLTDEQFDTIFSHFEADNEGNESPLVRVSMNCSIVLMNVENSLSECISFEKFLNGVEKWMKVVVNGNEKPSTLTTSKRDYLHSLLSVYFLLSHTQPHTITQHVLVLIFFNDISLVHSIVCIFKFSYDKFFGLSHDSIHCDERLLFMVRFIQGVKQTVQSNR